MNRAAACLLMMTVASLAGCADSPTAQRPGPATETQYQSEVLNLSAPVLPREPRVGAEINLTHTPAWRLGEWWTYRMSDEFTGKSYEFTRIVAGEDRFAGNYLVGFPAHEFSNDIMIFHVPGFGDITQADLSYETHDAYFQPLHFPLDVGESWDISFSGQAPGLAVVTEAANGIAQIETDIMGGMNITYDAALGEISVLDIPGYARYEVTGHGYDYAGLVRVPHAHDLLFEHGRLAGVVDLGSSGGVAAPSEVVNVPGGYDRLSFIIAVGGGAFLGALPTAGVFQEEVVAPNGTRYSAMWTPADIPTSGFVKIVAVGHEEPEGPWTMNHLAAGSGIAFVEGIGYHSIDIDLPSGCVVASVNAMHHAADCKTTRQESGEGSYSEPA